MLTEASGHVGEVPEAVSWVLAAWGPCVVGGAWCSGASLHCLSQLAEATKADLHVNLRGSETLGLSSQRSSLCYSSH